MRATGPGRRCRPRKDGPALFEDLEKTTSRSFPWPRYRIGAHQATEHQSVGEPARGSEPPAAPLIRSPPSFLVLRPKGSIWKSKYRLDGKRVPCKSDILARIGAMNRVQWLPCTSKPSPTGTRPQPFLREGWRENGKVRKRTLAICRSGPGNRPCADSSRTNRWSGAPTPSNHALCPTAMSRRCSDDGKLGRTDSSTPRLARARPCAGDGRRAHPRPRLQTRHRPGAGRAPRVTRSPRRWLWDRWRGRPVCGLDWLLERQDRIERWRSAISHKGPWCSTPDLGVDGRTDLPLAKRGRARDGKRGKLQIEFGLLCARDGCPMEVFAGHIADPSTVGAQVGKLASGGALAGGAGR